MSEEVKEVVEATAEKEMASVLIDHDNPIITVKKLMEAGAHFGHQTKRWNPKMKPYIYTARNGVYVLDLTKTVTCVNKAYAAMKKIVEDGGKVIFVGTKPNAQEIVQAEANRSGSFYTTSRWLGGTLTNFRTIQKRIKFLRDIEAMEKDGTFAVLPKKEVAQYYKEKEKLEKSLGGIKEMRRLPQAIFVVDPRIEINAVNEARKLRIPVFGIVDTNSDPDLCDYVIPGNDDSNKSVQLIVSVIADAIVEAKGGDMSQIVTAYTKDEGEATMDDAIANFDAVEKERQEARRAAMEARKAEIEKRNAARQAKFSKPKGKEFVKTTSDIKDTKEEVKVEASEAPAETVEAPKKPAAKKAAPKAVKEEVVEETPAAEKKPAAKKTTTKKTAPKADAE